MPSLEHPCKTEVLRDRQTITFTIRIPAAQKIADELFSPPSVVRLDLTLSETGPWHVNKVLTFGLGSLGSLDAGELLHELAHFVEIDEPRMDTSPYWGLIHPNTQDRSGRYRATAYEPKTMQMTAREIRVFAYQHHLHHHFGLPPWEDIPKLCTYLPDWLNVPGKNYVAKGKWISAQYQRLIQSKRYQYPAFLHEWRRRNALLAQKRAYRWRDALNLRPGRSLGK